MTENQIKRKRKSHVKPGPPDEGCEWPDGGWYEWRLLINPNWVFPAYQYADTLPSSYQI